MDYLGVGDAGRAKAVYIDRLIMMDGMTGEEIAHIPVDEPFRKLIGNPYAVIHRADLHGVLLDACRAHAKHHAGQQAARRRLREHRRRSAGSRPRRARSFESRCADRLRRHPLENPRADDRRRSAATCPAMSPIARCCRSNKMPEDLRWNAATIWAGPKCHMVHYPLQGWKTFNLVATFQTEVENVGINEPGNPEEMLSRFGHIVPQGAQDSGNSERVAALGAGRSRADRELDRRQCRRCWAMRRIPRTNISRKAPAWRWRTRSAWPTRSSDAQGNFTSAFPAYQENRIVRAYRVVLSARMLGRVYHAEGVERKIRNSVLGAKSANEFYDGLQWLYGAPGWPRECTGEAEREQVMSTLATIDELPAAYRQGVGDEESGAAVAADARRIAARKARCGARGRSSGDTAISARSCSRPENWRRSRRPSGACWRWPTPVSVSRTCRPHRRSSLGCNSSCRGRPRPIIATARARCAW